MDISHSVQFDFELALEPKEAVAFVRDARLSLSRASFVENLSQYVVEGETRVRASIPVNASLFGQRALSFASRLVPTPRGGRLEALELQGESPGWAEVSGLAEVRPHPGGSQVSYQFDITIHLNLPEPEKWGGRALIKMIHFTAHRVLRSITAEFPAAVQAAAREVEASFSRA